MKLGEALRLRSDNDKHIAALRVRAVAGAQIQDGQDAPDAPCELLADIERLRPKRWISFSASTEPTSVPG
ncbi:MAG: hypothetical protein IAI50_09330 [Candidatus Eremiobacteraeota bacterium]|nr:hypothetical protein [Candidatus Eremiobacteraeota bacterium]